MASFSHEPNQYVNLILTHLTEFALIFSVILWFGLNFIKIFFQSYFNYFSIIFSYVYLNYFCYFPFQETMKCLLSWGSLLCAVVNSIQVRPQQRVLSRVPPRGLLPHPYPQTGVSPRVYHPQSGAHLRGGGLVKTPRLKSGNPLLKSDLKVLLFLQVCLSFFKRAYVALVILESIYRLNLRSYIQYIQPIYVQYWTWFVLLK